VTDPVDVKALAETVRRGLGAGDRLMPGTMSEEEHLAGIALDALLAEVDRSQKRTERVASLACDLLAAVQPWQLQPAEVRSAAVRLTVALAALPLTAAELAAAGSPTGGDDAA